MASSTLFAQRQQTGLLLRLGAVALILVAGGWFVHARIEAEVLRLVENGLQSQRDTFATGVRNWLTSKRQFADVLVGRPLVREYARASLAGDADARGWLDAGIMQAGEHVGLHDYLLLDTDGLIHQRHRGPTDGALPSALRPRLSEAVESALVAPPVLLPVGTDGVPQPMLTAIAAFPSASGRPFGWLVLLFDPQAGLASFMATGHIGASGEVYLVDEAGYLLTPSRFPEQLRQIGLWPEDADTPILTVAVRDPQRDLTVAGAAPSTGSLPFTRAVTDLLAERDVGASMAPYRDYRGVPVVGSWEWLPGFGLGVVAELDAEEALRPLGVLRLIFVVLLVLLAAATVVGLVVSQRGALLRRRAAQAEAKLEQLGQYQLEKKIGEGGMGAVYLGHHAMMRRKTAIKLIHDQSESADLKLFEREVRLCCQLTHPNTIAIYDYGRNEAGTFYYAMEFLVGADLEVIVERTGPMPPARVIHVLAQACGSLAEAHTLNLIHRDIKPANIYLTERGGIHDFVKVLDFGLAKSLDKKAAQLTAADVISGTPPYMCPEIIEQRDRVDGRSDLYSLAIVGYFMLTGRLPFDREGVMDVLMAHVNDAPPRVSELTEAAVPVDLEQVLLQCLHKDPAQRPADAKVLRQQLLACEDAGGWTEADAARWWQEVWGDDPGTAQQQAMSSAVKASMSIATRR